MQRKSVSQTYFEATAVVLISGLLVMFLLQMSMTIRYFGTQRRDTLTATLDIAQARAEMIMASDVHPKDLEDNETLRRELMLINDATQTLLVVVDSEGNALRLNEKAAKVTGAKFSADALARLDAGKDVFVQSDMGGLFDSKYYILARRLDIGEDHAYILACFSGSDMYGYAGDMLSIFVLSAGLMLLVSSILSILLTNRITRPLHDIGQAARRFGGGDLTARVAVQGDDEVAGLAQTFNSMAANIESIDHSRSQFMGNIAHELRTPMTSIKGFVDGMLDGTIPPELQQHYLEVVSQESGRLARLVQNMLDITRLEAGEYKVHAQDYDVWHTITGVVLTNEQRITDGKVEIADLAPVTTLVHADPDLVHQVLQNLMDNALKFTPPGGRISFEAKRSQPGFVEVSITNTGAGISPEALPFVFERFYKEDKSRGLNAKGSGLGLHICKVLVTLSGGTIRVESEQGSWCRFSFTLPEPAQATIADRLARRPAPKTPENG